MLQVKRHAFESNTKHKLKDFYHRLYRVAKYSRIGYSEFAEDPLAGDGEDSGGDGDDDMEGVLAAAAHDAPVAPSASSWRPTCRPGTHGSPCRSGS